jgi:plastocyanin
MSKGARAVRGLGAVGAMALVLGIAACGGDDDASVGGGGGGAAETGAQSTAPASSGAGGLTIAADEKGGLSFDKKSLQASAGSVTITMDNPDGNRMPHNVAIEGNGVDEAGKIVQPGAESTVTADLKPGTYTFFCAVGQHRQAGMEGTLTVK